MKLPCREAPACLSRPDGMAEELPKIFGDIPVGFSSPEPISKGVQGKSFYQLFKVNGYGKLSLYEKSLSDSWDYWNYPSSHF
jgi:hypothetical protein